MADLLIVDDNPDMAEILEELLVAEGHQVRTAANGEEGLAALADRLPDLILSDVEMPVLDGPGLAYRLLVEDCGLERIPFVLISGAEDLPAVAERVGTPYVLAKPFALDVLLSLLARALAERRAPRPPRDP